MGKKYMPNLPNEFFQILSYPLSKHIQNHNYLKNNIRISSLKGKSNIYNTLNKIQNTNLLKLKYHNVPEAPFTRVEYFIKKFESFFNANNAKLQYISRNDLQT